MARGNQWTVRENEMAIESVFESLGPRPWSRVPPRSQILAWAVVLREREPRHSNESWQAKIYDVLSCLPIPTAKSYDGRPVGSPRKIKAGATARTAEGPSTQELVQRRLATMAISGSLENTHTITLGGVTATLEEVAQVLDALYDAPGDQMRHYLKNTPLEGMNYHQVSKEELTLFPEIEVPPGTRQHHVAHVRPACIHAMERLLSGSSWNETLVPLPKLPIKGSPSNDSGFDPISSRRTAKQNYGEDQARLWAEDQFPGALVVKVGSCVPKKGYDVQVTLADGSEIHIEAKYSENGSVVLLTEGERAHNQDNKCKHEHVLYIVTQAQVIKVKDEWHCSGGTKTAFRNWKIDTGNLKAVQWRYNIKDLVELSTFVVMRRGLPRPGG